MKKIILIPIILIISLANGFSNHSLKSPNGKIEVIVETENSISFSVILNGKLLIKNVDIELIFNSEAVYPSGKKYKASTKEIDEIVNPQVSYKDSRIEDNYNLLRFDFKNNFSLEFRAYNDGIAYRHITNKDEEVEVNEIANFTFNDDFKLWASPIKAFQSSYEVPYQQLNISAFPDTMNTYLPLLIADNEGNKILMTEADIYDYPHMFLKSGEANQLTSTFPPFPLETELIGDRGSKIIKGADYIAKTNAKRTFPWRMMIITENDAQLVKSNMVYLLSRNTVIENPSWIKPGRVAWDWWNASNLYGVDFESGINTETYKYYIDFASNNKLEYIILDEGWSISTTDLTKANPDLDLEALIAYGNTKNVKIILWATWRAIDEQWFVLDAFRDWGAAGVKIDFMNRADQWMVNFYEKAAKETAKRELLVDFHGAHKPTGLRRAYPNVVSYEGVCGLEQSKWSKRNSPENNITIPFIRMVCGPMDYTPGAMRNFQSEKFTPNFIRPASQGTRAHQVALFIVYESGIQMFADSPTNYEREQETTDFLAEIPVTWDEIRVLKAKVGEYIIVARRSGENWFIGGLTDNTERTFTLDLSFLGSKDYNAVILQDGINSDKFAEDYKITEQTISNDTEFKITMKKGGGFSMRIE